MKKQDIMINVENPTHFSISLKVGGTSDFIVLAPDSTRLMSECEYLEHKDTLMTFGCKITPMEVHTADTADTAEDETAVAEKAAVTVDATEVAEKAAVTVDATEVAEKAAVAADETAVAEAMAKKVVAKKVVAKKASASPRTQTKRRNTKPTVKK